MIYAEYLPTGHRNWYSSPAVGGQGMGAMDKERRLVLLGGGVGAALLVLSLLVSLVWYPDPATPVFKLPGSVPSGFPTELPGILPTDFPTDLPTDFPTILPTDFPTIPDMPDLSGGDS
jgi:hypothetical protein